MLDVQSNLGPRLDLEVPLEVKLIAVNAARKLIGNNELCTVNL
jgi:hypothetical protein